MSLLKSKNFYRIISLIDNNVISSAEDVHGYVVVPLKGATIKSIIDQLYTTIVLKNPSHNIFGPRKFMDINILTARCQMFAALIYFLDQLAGACKDNPDRYFGSVGGVRLYYNRIWFSMYALNERQFGLVLRSIKNPSVKNSDKFITIGITIADWPDDVIPISNLQIRLDAWGEKKLDKVISLKDLNKANLKAWLELD